jgi:hypothetical protein
MTTVSPAPRPLVAFSGREPDVAVSTLGGIYRARDWTTGPADAAYWFRYVGVGDERLSIRRFQLHGWLRGDAATADDVVVQWLESGRSTVDVGHGRTPVRLGVPVPLPVGRHFRVEHDHPDQRLVHLSRALVVDVASERYVVDDAVTFAGQQVPDPGAVAGVLLGTRFHDWAPTSRSVRRVFRVGYESVRPLGAVETGWLHLLDLWVGLRMVPDGDDPAGWGAAVSA